jgi:nicotinate-nucleotide adenylyltransferase
VTGIFVPEAPATQQAIGILGGTFDPVHIGHITLAEDIQKHLLLDRMYLMPCHLPPHRGKPGASHRDRLHMLQLATTGTSLLIDERELQREGPSYTFDTLLSLRRQYGPLIPLIWCLGMDAFAAFNTWHRWREIPSLAHLLVVTRAGYDQRELADDLRQLLAEHPCAEKTDLKNTAAGNIYLTQLSQIPVSSTQVRQQLAQGVSPAAALKPAVYHYIQERGLYLTR